MINLWLDDLRPAPPGWTHARTVDEAKPYLEAGLVVYASLDHDLGACPDCLGGMTPNQWLVASQFYSMPNCEHFGTGYTLVCWMEETGHWPKYRPTVHSANTVGKHRMELAIAREWLRRAEE